MSEIRCEIITQLADWIARWDQTTELVGTSDVSTPHTTMSWLVTWWKSFGSEHNLQIGLFWGGSQLIGYAPLMLSHFRFLGIPYTLLHFVGEGYSDYADIFSRDDDINLKNEMIDLILADWKWDELSLINIPESSNTHSVLKKHVGINFHQLIRYNTRCLFIDLHGRTFKEYYRSLSRNHRRELQKRKHKLDSLGPWSLEFNSGDPPDIMFEQFRKLNTGRANEKGWVPVYEDPAFRSFFCSLLNKYMSDMDVVYSTLQCNDVLLSYTLGFVVNNKYYHWNIGFDREFGFVSPNKLHHQFLIEECFKRGYDEFDFMRGDSEYKFKWTQMFRRNLHVSFLKKGGMRGALNYLRMLKKSPPAWLTFLKVAKRKIIKHIPPVGSD